MSRVSCYYHVDVIALEFLSDSTLVCPRVNEVETISTIWASALPGGKAFQNLMLQNARLIVASSVARGAFLMLQSPHRPLPTLAHSSLRLSTIRTMV